MPRSAARRPTWAELDHLLRSRLGADLARAFAEDVVAGAYDLALTPDDITGCLEIDRHYSDLGVGLADAARGRQRPRFLAR